MSGASGEILTIGTELLLGEIVDTNSAYLAKALRQAGINLYSTATVGDNVSRISQAIQSALSRSDFVITTGGLGPTVDDMTRQAVAQAAGVELEFHIDLWRQIQERFARFGRQPDENNRRQAHLPNGATGIENPIGTAPAFRMQMDNGLLYALPGVPAEMKRLLHEVVMPDLQRTFQVDRLIVSRLLRTAGVGESSLDSKIQDLEEAENPTLGIAAHPGRVDLRLTASANSTEQAEMLLNRLEAELRRRVGDYIYGRNGDSLEAVVLQLVADRGWQLVTIESGTGGFLASSLVDAGAAFLEGRVLPSASPQALSQALDRLIKAQQTTVGLSLGVEVKSEIIEINGRIVAPDFEIALERSYGGPPQNAPAWGASLLLEKLRRRLLE